MNLFGQLVGQFDMAPFATGMGRAGDPATGQFPQARPLTRHLAGDKDLRGRRAGIKGIDKGHDIHARELGVFQLHLVGEGAARIRLSQQPPFVHLNDHIGYVLRVTAGQAPKQADTHPTDDMTTASNNQRTTGRLKERYARKCSGAMGKKKI